jgi:hypothetical protein
MYGITVAKIIPFLIFFSVVRTNSSVNNFSEYEITR